MKTTSISARIDPETAKTMLFLEKKLGLAKTAIIVKAIHHLSDEVKQKKPKRGALEILKSSGFIGSFRGESDLSETYKKKLKSSLKEKHGMAPKRPRKGVSSAKQKKKKG